MKNKKIIGILGGMGPEASVYLYNTLINLSVKYFGAKNNDDFPEIVLHSIPVPDFISNDKSRLRALKMLKARVLGLNQLNVSFLAIACNTAHILLNKLQKLSNVPFVSMIDEAVRQIKANNHKKVGLLSTPSTMRYGLYQAPLLSLGIKTIIPTTRQQKSLEMIIRKVLENNAKEKHRFALIKIADSLKKRGAEGVILGCTELPLVFPKKYSLPLYNSVEILALALLRNYYGRDTIKKI